MSERLEELVQDLSSNKLELAEFINDYYLMKDRVEELEKEIENLEMDFKHVSHFKNLYQNQRRIYKQALEEIRSEASGYMSNSAAQRLYDIANEALEQENE